MVFTRRDFLRYSAVGLSSLVLGDSNLFSEEQDVALPTLEEIINNLSRTHNEVLEPAIKKGNIKKFNYTRQTTPDDFYKFLNNNFKERIVFIHSDIDEGTYRKNIWKSSSAPDEKTSMELSAGSATIFYYTMLNLKKSNSDIGFLFLELVDFHGEENWEELKQMFDNKLKGFPSYVEFKRERRWYEFSDVVKSSVREQEVILGWINDLVRDYRKRTSK